MHDKEFWDLIDWTNARSADRYERDAALTEALRTLSPEQIEDFYLRYDERLTAAWTKELKCAACLINHPGDVFEDDDFVWFLQWLIDRGKADYDAALAIPDTLADIEEEEPWQSDGYWEQALDAWCTVTARTRDQCWERLSQRGASDPTDLPSGGGFSHRYLKKHYPRLFARFAED